MQMLFSYSYYRRVPLTGVLCLLLVGALAGCATKNPLMEEPASSATARNATPAATQKTSAASATSSAPSANRGSTGVQTVKERRLFGFLSPYRIDIPQGNFVSQEMVSQLKEGMTPDQVRFVLGTPLLSDMFHADRWDYPFRLQKGNGEVTMSRVVVFFKDNRLLRFEGGDLPTEQDYLDRVAGAPATKK
jgi:outer membrane protein assembly factor BamE